MPMAGATTPRWPFVGRRVELERIVDAAGAPEHAAVLVVGASGVGKSRLAAEALTRLKSLGHPAAHVVASVNASAVPLSAMLPLLPPIPPRGEGPEQVPASDQDPYMPSSTTSDPRHLFEGAADRIAAAAGGRRLAMVVDDVDLLDATSLALVAHLLAAGRVFLIATQRSDSRVPDMLATLWRSDRALRIELGGMSRASLDTLLHLALGAPVTAPAAQALWEASLGNLLYLRELVTAASTDGALGAEDGAWRLVGRLASAGGVRALVGERLSRLGDAERAVLEILALCQPIGLQDLLDSATYPSNSATDGASNPEDILTGLERVGLVVVEQLRRRQEVSLAHPLHAEVLRESMPRLLIRSVLLAQIARVTAHGARRGGDALLLASWLLDATGAADAELLVHAAGLALYGHDMERARKLAEAALHDGPHVRASLLLGTALAELGRGQEAVECLRAAFDNAEGADAGPVAQALAVNLFYTVGDLDETIACLREAARRSPRSAPELAAAQAVYLSMSGRVDEAAAVLRAEGAQEAVESIEGAESAESKQSLEARKSARVHILRARTRILLDSGRVVDAAQAATQSFEAHRDTDERTTLYHPAGSLLPLASALCEQGRLAESASVAERGQRMAVEAGAVSLTPWFSWCLGRSALFRGRPAAAVRHFLEAVAQARPAGDPTPELLAQAGLVLAHATTRSLDAVEEPLVRMIELADRLPVRHADVDRARARGPMHRTGVSAACDALRASAALHLGGGHHTHAVTLLHEAVRLGDPAATELLPEAAAAMQGPYAAARAAHARALRARDTTALTTVAQSFEELGAELAAAETLLTAARLWREDGDPRAAAQADRQAAALAARCEGAFPAGLLSWHTASPLSAREREVSALVVEGLTSKQIAERLYLSVRTVDNHLQNIYAKLGVANRAELAAGLTAPTSEAAQTTKATAADR